MALSDLQVGAIGQMEFIKLGTLGSKGAIDYARLCGARLIEAYPVDKQERERDDSMWFGAKSMYDRAGFVEVARRKPTRPVVRKTLRPQRESKNRSS